MITGHDLRTVRRAADMTLAAMAAAGRVSEGHLSRVESGERQVTPATVALYRRVTGLAIEPMAATDSDRVEVPQAMDDSAAGIDPVDHASLAMRLLAMDQEGWDTVYRRTFVAGVGGLAGLSMVAPALALEASRLGLASRLAEQRADADVEEWQAIVTEHGYSYMTSAPAELLKDLIVDVLGLQCAVERQPDHPDEPTLRGLRRVGAMLAALMAMTVANLGDVRHSARWWRTARRVAHQSGDANVVVWVRGREVVRALYEQRPVGAILHLVAEAESVASRASRVALPELLIGKAQTLAVAGRADDALSSLDRVRELFDALPNVSTADGSTVFGWAEDRLRFAESFVYSHLGRVSQADEAQRQAIALYPQSFRRGPAQIELQRALCHVSSGDVVEGVRHAQTVLAALDAADHIRPIFDLGDRVLHAVPNRDRTHVAVASYRECLAALAPHPTKP